MTSGFKNLLGLDVARLDDGSAVIELDAGEAHLNPHGTVHGGAIATLVDSAMGAAISTDGTAPVTIEMKVTYLQPGRPGKLRAAAKVRKRGKRILIAEAEVTDEGDELIALALGTFTAVD